ncbi:MAG: carboxypeptidase-like regulatory domain-containing protein, partial [FCB group bacterium]|nr:carboxypeptidase-like regulatory domain-containing protein [FCB group bacterium]
QTVGGVEIVLGSGGRLQGTVILDGEAAPGAVVTISGMGFNRVVTADRNGQYLIEGIPPGQYLAAAMSPEAIAAGRFAPSHGQVVIVEGQTTQYNFGDAQGATVEGLCTPPPSTGSMGFAVLRIAGTGAEVSQLDFRSLTSIFMGDMSSVPSIVGLAPVDRDGWFQIENAPEGSYSLDVYYLTLGNFVTSQGRRVFSTMIDIRGKETVSLQIAATQ